MRYHFLNVSAAMLALAAAAAISSAAHAAPAAFDLTKLEQATQADLTSAKADADAHGDVFASQCYGGVSDYMANNPVTVALPDINGVASAFQAGRDVVKGVAGGVGAVPPELVQACGPLALDVQNDIAKAAAGGFSIFGLKL